MPPPVSTTPPVCPSRPTLQISAPPWQGKGWRGVAAEELVEGDRLACSHWRDHSRRHYRGTSHRGESGEGGGGGIRHGGGQDRPEHPTPPPTQEIYDETDKDASAGHEQAHISRGPAQGAALGPGSLNGDGASLLPPGTSPRGVEYSVDTKDGAAASPRVVKTSLTGRRKSIAGCELKGRGEDGPRLTDPDSPPPAPPSSQ